MNRKYLIRFNTISYKGIWKVLEEHSRYYVVEMVGTEHLFHCTIHPYKHKSIKSKLISTWGWKIMEI